jgi:glutathione peroxidase
MKKAIVCFLLVSLTLGCVSCDSEAPEPEHPSSPPAPAAAEPEAKPPAAPSAPAKPLYAFELDDIDSNPVKLAQYQGKALLLVNVASKCGYTKQYAGLQSLYEKYQDKGLVVLGFPANNFGAQEPGTNEEIKAFCATTFGVTFPMFAKISVKGDDIDPLYAFLTSGESHPDFAGPIKWNFNKFLVDRDGDVVGRYDSKVEPMSAELAAEIETALGQTSS